MLTTYCWLACTVVSFAQATSSKKKATKTQKTNIQTAQNEIKSNHGIIEGLDIILDFVIEDDIMKEDDDESESNVEEEVHINGLETSKTKNKNSSNSSVEGIVTSSLDELAVQKVNIFPMPATSYFNIQVENNTIENYKLLNAAGQIIRIQQLNGNSTIVKVETTSLAKGVYYIVLNTNSKPISRSIIIQ